MAQIEVAEAAFAGFQVMRAKPWPVLAWGALNVLVLYALLILFGGEFFAVLLPIMKAGPSPDPATVAPVLGKLLLYYAGFLAAIAVVSAITSAAACRAVLTPEDSAFGYLRLGPQELWLLAVYIVEFVLVLAAVFVASLVTGLIAAIAPGAPILGLVGFVAAGVLAIYLMARFAVAAPATVALRRFGLGESWRLTRGHVGSILLLAIIVAALFAAVWILSFIVGLAVGLVLPGGGLGASGDPERLVELFSHPDKLVAQMWPALIVQGLTGSVFSGAYAVIGNAPWARLYRQLQTGPEVATTFS